jgi:PAS domain S-box-containing protein
MAGASESLPEAPLIDLIEDAVIVIGGDCVVVKWNDGATRIFGWNRAEATGRQLSTGIEGASDSLAAASRRVAESGREWSGELAFSRRDGSAGLCEAVIKPLARRRVLINVRDITRKWRFEEQVAEERRLLRTVIDGIPDVVIFKDRDGRYVMRNEAHRTLTGLPDEAVIGRGVLELPFPPELADAYHFDDVSVIDTGEPVINREEPFRQPDGRDGWFLTSKYPIRDASGAISGLVMIARDITERRRAVEERQDIERKLLETQKLESLGVLAGGIAHDFNNLLTGILGNASLAAMDIGGDSEARLSLDQIERAATRAADLCKQMLAYSGKGRFVIANHDLNGVIQETTELLRLSISKRAELHFMLGENLPPVLSDATQLRQVIMNLVINASEAIGEKDGAITVATGNMHADADYLATCHTAPGMTPGEFVWFEVSDDGCGMPADVQARIFDPFFTTKFTGRGLGLAAVLGIVRGHKGAMNVCSEPGMGTTFRILLPAVAGTSDDIDAPATTDTAWRAEGLALVVDDDETVRAITARMLRSFGFDVETACDGREGVDKLTAAGAVRAVLLDLTMPKLDGEQAFQEMRLIDPGVRVLLMSGFSEQEAIKRFAGKGLAGFLQKPFNVGALRDRLREVLA